MKTREYPNFTEDNADAKPSVFKGAHWIYAQRQKGTYPERKETSGKWLVFAPVELIDSVWARIKRATEVGRLGNVSKVSTAFVKPTFKDSGRRVVCVYTYDGNDEEDVMRVRDELKKLGFVSKLSYKTDQDSREGKYRVKGDKNISKYYA